MPQPNWHASPSPLLSGVDWAAIRSHSIRPQEVTPTEMPALVEAALTSFTPSREKPTKSYWGQVQKPNGKLHTVGPTSTRSDAAKSALGLNPRATFVITGHGDNGPVNDLQHHHRNEVVQNKVIDEETEAARTIERPQPCAPDSMTDDMSGKKLDAMIDAMGALSGATVAVRRLGQEYKFRGVDTDPPRQTLRRDMLTPVQGYTDAGEGGRRFTDLHGPINVWDDPSMSHADNERVFRGGGVEPTTYKRSEQRDVMLVP